jgi:hypothetical protein
LNFYNVGVDSDLLKAGDLAGLQDGLLFLKQLPQAPHNLEKGRGREEG